MILTLCSSQDEVEFTRGVLNCSVTLSGTLVQVNPVDEKSVEVGVIHFTACDCKMIGEHQQHNRVKIEMMYRSKPVASNSPHLSSVNSGAALLLQQLVFPNQHSPSGCLQAWILWWRKQSMHWMVRHVSWYQLEHWWG